MFVVHFSPRSTPLLPTAAGLSQPPFPLRWYQHPGHPNRPVELGDKQRWLRHEAVRVRSFRVLWLGALALLLGGFAARHSLLSFIGEHVGEPIVLFLILASGPLLGVGAFLLWRRLPIDQGLARGALLAVAALPTALLAIFCLWYLFRSEDLNASLPAALATTQASALRIGTAVAAGA